MLSYFESLAVVVLSALAALCMMLLLNRILDDGVRQRANSVNGWQLSILGSIYAVSLGFMLSDAWIAYQTANADVRDEAAAALTIYRTSVLLPSTCAVPLQSAVQQYLRTVDQEEWPSMQRHSSPSHGAPIARRMWTIINGCELSPGSSARESAVGALEILQRHRGARVQDYDGHLPLIMWSVLLFGAVVVVTSSCLLGNEKRSIHRFHVLSLTVLISVTLLAIADLDRPFDGATRIQPAAFRAVLADITQEPAP
jgi:hypothetical protein